MKAFRLHLESFDQPDPGGPGNGPEDPATAEVLAEDQRLAAYEKGYAAGWEDAVAASGEDAARLREDLTQNLRELSFTFHEARMHVLRSLEPLLRAMVERVLPEIARKSFGALVVGEAMAAAGSRADSPVEIAVSPGSVDAVRAALGDETALPLRIVPDPFLVEGQARFRMGAEEAALDLDAMLGRIRGLVDDFLGETQQRIARDD